MRSTWQDLRYAFRVLAKSPGFTLVAIVTLALGIGINTGIFSVMNAALFRPLPVEQPNQLVTFRDVRDDGGSSTSLSYPDYAYYRDHNEVFSSMLVYGAVQLSWRRAESDALVRGYLVSGNYFDMLGVEPVLGRGFLPEEDQTLGTHPVAVVSHEFWRQRLAGDPNAVGSSLVLNGHNFTLVGVAPPGFRGTDITNSPDVWAPTMAQPLVRPGEQHLTRGHRWMKVVGRLRPGVSIEQAQANADVMYSQLLREFPNEFDARRVQLEPTTGLPGEQSSVLSAFAMLMAVVGLILLIACGNVANLFLERATARRKEIAIRLAMGAGRARIVRQLLVEGALLSLAGAAAGLLLAVWATEAAFSIEMPFGGSLGLDLTPDGRVLGYTAALSLLTVMFFGLAPALRATRPDVMPSLKDDASGVPRPGRFNLRGALVVGQVALCFVVLACAGLFLRNLQRTYAVDLGFNSERVLLMSFDLNLHGYDEPRAKAFGETLLADARALPGVESAAFAHVVPLDFNSSATMAVPEGTGADPNDRRYRVEYSQITPSYFETAGIPLRAGRDFTERDREGSTPVAIVNESLAQRYWPNESAVGKRIHLWGPDSPLAQVVGVATDSKYGSLTEEGTPFLYMPLLIGFRPDVNLLLRTRGAPRELLQPLRDSVRTIDPAVAVMGVRTFEEQVGRAYFLPRNSALLLSGFGMLALLLAAVGLYGVISYTVSRRTREVGIRMALGARHADVLGLVVGEGFRLALVGVAVGLAAAFTVTRFLGGMLYRVSPTDPLTFVIVPAVLTVVAVVASYVPARRASRVDPMRALRYE
jgi:predicted permease